MTRVMSTECFLKTQCRRDGGLLGRVSLCDTCQLLCPQVSGISSSYISKIGNKIFHGEIGCTDKSKGKIYSGLRRKIRSRNSKPVGTALSLGSLSLCLGLMHSSCSASLLLFPSESICQMGVGTRHPHASSVLVFHDKGKNKLEYC